MGSVKDKKGPYSNLSLNKHFSSVTLRAAERRDSFVSGFPNGTWKHNIQTQSCKYFIVHVKGTKLESKWEHEWSKLGSRVLPWKHNHCCLTHTHTHRRRARQLDSVKACTLCSSVSDSWCDSAWCVGGLLLPVPTLSETFSAKGEHRVARTKDHNPTVGGLHCTCVFVCVEVKNLPPPPRISLPFT